MTNPQRTQPTPVYYSQEPQATPRELPPESPPSIHKDSAAAHVDAPGGGNADLLENEGGPLHGSGKVLGYTCTVLPRTLLWQPAMANARQPRMDGRITSLDNSTTHDTIDTAIGGVLALGRITTPGCLQIQQDFQAVVFSRFTNRSEIVAIDYGLGFPLTFSYKNWHGKIAYEHYSTHLGDDFIRRTLQFRQPYNRDDIVLGLDYLFGNQLRVYGVAGYAAFGMSTPTPGSPARYDWGIEWSRYVTTGWAGQPSNGKYIMKYWLCPIRFCERDGGGR